METHRSLRLLQPIAIAVLLIGAALAFAACGSSNDDEEPPPDTPTPTATATATPTPTPSPTPTPEPPAVGVLDGVPMDREDFRARSTQMPVAVMIDNHPSAYPHTGLNDAELVFEAFVEGQVTRYMAVYWRVDSDYIEPVRSVRTPFAIWASELQALIGHVGASEYAGEANALAAMREWDIPHLDHDEDLGPPTFYRNPNRRAPHNVITATEDLRAMAQTMGIHNDDGIQNLESWQFKDPGEDTTAYPDATIIDVRYSGSTVGGSTDIRWVWDPSSASYLRYRAGSPHVDGQTGQHVSFTNVVAMVVNPRVVSPYGHVVLDQIGEGPATVYLDGKRIRGTWEKPSRQERTRFYAADGQEIAFNPGSTWLQVVAPTSSVIDNGP